MSPLQKIQLKHAYYTNPSRATLQEELSWEHMLFAAQRVDQQRPI